MHRPNASAACFHCGLPVARGIDFSVVIEDELRAMCCAGCQAIARTIVESGLISYYRQRSALPARDDSVPQLVRELAAYEVPAVERVMARDVGGHDREAALMLEGIVCAACTWLIEQHISRLPGVLCVEINYATHRARVRWDGSRTRLAAILAAVAALGYRAHPYDSARAEQARRGERDRALWRLFVAGFGMMQVMMYLVPMYLGDDAITPDVEQLMRIASLILTLPVVLFSAAPFFRGAWRDLRVRRAGMDVPVALGIGAAFAASVIATLDGGGQVYFDSVTMFVFLLLAARYVEMTARARAAVAQERLARQTPAVAERLAAWPASGLAEMVSVADVVAGNHLRVRPGALIPADGVLVEGASYVDERFLTGESRPQSKRIGDFLAGGSINAGNPLVMRVTRVGADSILGGILRLLDRAAAEKPRLARYADQVAQYFVLALLAVAAVVAAVWLKIEAGHALWVTVAVLVVSCPCALSLATPAALAAATAALHERGVLIARGDALENLARSTDFVFDKTGTLTTGVMRLVEVKTFSARTGDECIALAARIESASVHPIARALVAAAGDPAVENCRETTDTAGAGVEAIVNGRRVRLGTPQFVAALTGTPPPHEFESIPDDLTMAALGDESGWAALFLFADPLRGGARELVDKLSRMGARVHLLSGDRPQIVEHVARSLGIDRTCGGMTPRDKLDAVRRLQDGGAVVAMIGDGVNDAAALAAAQVSVASGGGVDIACGNSDVILLSGRLDGLLAAVTTARATMRIVRQNLAWAFAYNLTAVPLAACGYVTPLLAGAGMAASSTLVVLNALRLLRRAPAPQRAKALN